MLTADESRRLDSVAFGPFVAAAGESGPRIARGRGAGVEFHDYRRYQPGDDPRTIDWTIRARLRQLVVREFRPDAHLKVHLLVDASGSMAVGTPQKLACAKKLAATLAYVATRRRDAVALAIFDDLLRCHVGLGGGTAHFHKVTTALGAATPSGASDVNRALTTYAGAIRGPGVAIVISDFFDGRDPVEGLSCLQYRGLVPCVVHVLAPEELDPEIADSTDLIDVENAGPRVRVGPDAVDGYRRALHGEMARTERFCAERSLPCLVVPSSLTFPGILRVAMSAGVLTSRGPRAV